MRGKSRDNPKTQVHKPNLGHPPHNWSLGHPSAKKIREKLEYMHTNPVKRGLVKKPGEWMWSSFAAYEKGEGGLISIDFVD